MSSRPQLVGRTGMVTSTHWLGSAAGMAMLERGGSAADAAAACGFVLQVVEPHMVGPGGDLPVIVAEPGGDVHVVCGQGGAPATATIEEYRRRGLTTVPGYDVLSAVVPGSFGGWLTLVERWGRLRLRDVLEPALDLARTGFPITPGLAQGLAALAPHFRRTWPTSAAVWLTHDGSPAAGSSWRLPGLAATWERLLDEAEGAGGHSREQEIERARHAWYDGFVAEEIDRFSASREGLLSADDLSGWTPRIEAPVTYDYRGWTVCKAGPWSQGPVFLQQLALLSGYDLDGLAASRADIVHLATECAKLAFADREAWYGDPDYVDVPLATLLSSAYNDDRRRLVDLELASADLRPGSPDGRSPVVPAYDVLASDGSLVHMGGAGEPSLAEALRPGDTVHLDTVDADGLLISATPSGGWLQSSPAIPSLGFCLGTRGQMFWLDEATASALGPGRRPRTTLTPSIALGPDGRRLAFGTPGGDQQDQWSLLFFLRYAHSDDAEPDLQATIDAPAWHTEHMASSFWPRQARPNHVLVEDRVGEETVAELRRRGHDVEVVDGWTLGRVTAVADDRPVGGWLRAAATSRGVQGYAAGR